MGWAVLTQADGVVRPDIDQPQAGHRRQSHRAAHIVAEYQERGRIRDEAAVQGDAADGGTHGVFSDADADVAPARVGGLEDACALDGGQVRFGQARRATEELRQWLRQGIDRLLAGLARRGPIADWVRLEAARPAVGEAAGKPSLEFGRFRWVLAGVGGQLLVPIRDELLTLGDRLAESGKRRVRYEEMRLRIPAVGNLGAADFVLAQRRAVGLLRVVFRRRAESDVRPHGDQAGPPIAPRRLDSGPDSGHVVAVLNLGRVPAVRVEALERPVGEGEGRGPVEFDVVVVVEVDKLAQFQVPRQRRGLGGDPLLQVAVGADGVHEMIDQVVARPVELSREAALGNRHPDAIRESLAERSGRRLDTLRMYMLRVAGSERAPLAERLQVLERQPVAGQIEQRVEQHAGVAGGEQEAVSIRPARVAGGVAQELRPQRVGHRRHPHRGAGMARVGLLNGVHGKRPNGVDRELVEVSGDVRQFDLPLHCSLAGIPAEPPPPASRLSSDDAILRPKGDATASRTGRTGQRTRVLRAYTWHWANAHRSRYEPSVIAGPFRAATLANQVLSLCNGPGGTLPVRTRPSVPPTDSGEREEAICGSTKAVRDRTTRKSCGPSGPSLISEECVRSCWSRHPTASSCRAWSSVRRRPVAGRSKSATRPRTHSPSATMTSPVSCKRATLGATTFRSR